MLIFSVNSWASQFGDELNWLAKNMTKADEIKKVSAIHVDFLCPYYYLKKKTPI